MPNEILVVFLNGSNYDYRFIVKELANVFKDTLNVFRKILKKVQKFYIPIEKEIRKVDKDGNENIIKNSSKIKCIDSARFVANLLSNLVDNLAEEIHQI